MCIIDDREDVWNFAPNLVHVKPYHFFQHTGDINAPPGLAKCENDDKEGFDFTKISGDQHTFYLGFQGVHFAKILLVLYDGYKSDLSYLRYVGFT